MDTTLKLLADASLEVTAAEEALEEGAFHNARDRLDAAGTALTELRAAWRRMDAGERGVVGPAGRAVRDRLDRAAARIPRLTALSEGAPVDDPEHEEAPA